MTTAKICSVDGCERPHYAKGLCNPHWQRDRKGLPLQDIADRYDTSICKFPDCGRARAYRGYCQTHYKQDRLGQELQPIRTVGAQGGPCMVPGCETPSFSKGCCRVHHHVTRYNLSDEQIIKLYTEPHCRICGVTDNGSMNFHIDHDHSCCSGHKSCGKCVRGLLCRSCNHGIGMLKDDIAILQSAIAYLSSADRI